MTGRHGKITFREKRSRIRYHRKAGQINRRTAFKMLFE